MIIKNDKTFETNSMFPNEDWYNEDNYILDETTTTGKEMAKIYSENYPFVDFKTQGKVVTEVVVLEKLEIPPEIEGKRIKLTKKNDQWEYVYIDLPSNKVDELETKLTEQQQIIDAMLGVSE